MRAQIQVDAQFLLHVFLIALLLIAALTLATRFGFVQCGQIPYWCEGYHRIMSAVLGRTYPSILILYGDEGMGDPEKLRHYLYETCHLYVDKEHIRYLSPGNLNQYDVIIVEHAKYMTAEQLSALWDFVANGGKLIFVADSGTEGNDILREENAPINPWDRETEDEVIRFGKHVLGLRYLGNYCDDCNDIYARFVPSNDFLTAGVTTFRLSSNFAVVAEYGSSLFGLQYRSASIADVSGKYGLRPPYPGIVRVGYRVIYFAFPPETLIGKGAAPQGAVLLLNLCDYLENV